MPAAGDRRGMRDERTKRLGEQERTLDDLISDIAFYGWEFELSSMINKQTKSITYRAEVSVPDKLNCWSFYQATRETPFEALQAALDIART